MHHLVENFLNFGLFFKIQNTMNFDKMILEYCTLENCSEPKTKIK